MEAKCRVGRVKVTLEQLNEAGGELFPGLVGIEFDDYTEGIVRARLALRPELQAPNGYLHAGAIVTLADTACGYGCFLTKPDEATGFTTIELKTNFLRSAREGTIACEARLVHGGRTTQLWDATISDAEGRTMALFRATQLLLYPR
jgi:1,4-dihydroxy-2-naphthoyl-CoA hydrolase